MHTVKLLYHIAIFSLLMGTSAISSGVIESPREDSLFYYKIGGGRNISLPPQMTITTISLSASASYSGLNCGAFDPVTSIKNSLEDLKNGVDDAINAVEAAAGAAIANLPGYILQKANPGLYDLFQNGLLRAQESFSLATKSCERMEYEISNNINPYAEWITLSRGDSWKRSVGIGEKDIHKAKEDAKNAQNDGFNWIGGVKKGDSNSNLAVVLSDVATAGMNILSQRPVETKSNLPSNSPLVKHFSGPAEVSKWIRDVLGDIQIGTCDDCEVGKTPGRGLIPYIESEAEDVKVLLIDFVSETKDPNRINLETIAAPGIAITLQVIRAIQNQSPEEQAIVIDKLSQEIAESRIMEESMIIRRFLITGLKEGNISATGMAIEEVRNALAELDQEIDNVILEKKIRAEFVSDTIVELLRKDNSMRQSSINTKALSPEDKNPLQQGGVKK